MRVTADEDAGHVPPQPFTRPRDAHLPAGNQRIVHDRARDFQHRARGREKQVGADQPPRGGERQRDRGVQSAASGANRTPRSSRMSPSRL